MRLYNFLKKRDCHDNNIHITQNQTHDNSGIRGTCVFVKPANFTGTPVSNAPTMVPASTYNTEQDYHTPQPGDGDYETLEPEGDDPETLEPENDNIIFLGEVY